MSVIGYIKTRELTLDHRWFAAFLVLQVAAVALVLYDQLGLVLMAVAAAAAAIFLAYLIIYPWLLIPIIIAFFCLQRYFIRGANLSGLKG